MANEFKIKKGLIVTGASGGTVVDIQGSQGQLFSVTDDLSGSIFAVSDISGVPIFDVNSSGLSTFDGPATFASSVTLSSTIPILYLENTTTTTGKNWRLSSAANGKMYIAQDGVVDAITLDHTSGNATFAGKITSGNDIVNATAGVYTWVNDTDTYIQRSAGNEITFKTGASTALVLNSSQNATFSAKAYGVAPITSDPDSTIATKGYVQSVITGATIYRGTWNPDVSLNSGYGNPNLNTVTQTSGYYYICSADGAATPNGTGNEPDSWNTGDWVIWNDDVGTSGEWQKIDNSSVLSGVGTGQTVALWEGPNTVTDSETLGNAPITFSGNNATFAGNVNVGANTLQNGANPGLKIQSTNTAQTVLGLHNTTSRNWEVAVGGTTNGIGVGSWYVYDNTANDARLEIDTSGDATFAGDVKWSGGVGRLVSNQLQSGYNQNADNADFWINYQGYQGGTTYFRDFRVGDGKQGQIAFFDGSTKDVTFSGTVISTNSTAIEMDGANLAEGIRLTADASTDYPVFLRSTNPGSGETSPWLYMEQVNAWGIWHNNPINSFDFTRSTVATGIEQNVGGTTNTVMIRLNNTNGSGIFVGSVTAANFIGPIAGYLPLSAGSGFPLTGDLHYNGSIRSTTPTSKLILSNSSTTTELHAAGSGGISFKDSGNNAKMVIDTNGNVGIETTTPVGKLYVGPTWDTTSGGNNLYIKDPTVDQDSYDPQTSPTSALGITMVTDSATTTGPDTVGLTLYNDDGTAGGFSPMLLFSKLETPTSQFKATMAGIYARSPLGTGNGGSWIDGELIFATAGAATHGIKQRMVINKEGLVGIGTATPSAKLDIQGTQGQLFSVTDDLSGSIFAVADISGVPIFDVNSSGVSYFDGNVGIGTASPRSILNLARAGTDNYIKVEAGLTSGNYSGIMLTEAGIDFGWTLRMNAATDLLHISYQDNVPNFSDAVTFTRAGNVGIGTTGPTDYGASANTLEVRGASGTGAGLVRVSNAGNTVGAAFYSGSASSTLGTQTNHELNIATNNTSRVVIGNTGAVKFSAYAAGTLVTDASGNISVSSGGGAGGPYLPLSAGASYPLTGALHTDGTIFMSAGNPGIIMQETDVTDKNWDIQVNGGNLKFYEVNDARSVFSEKVTFKAGGNVGIGATGPTQKLQLGVNGSLADSIRIGSYAVAKDTRQYIGYTRADSGLFESSGSGDTPSTVLAGVAGIRIVNTAGTLASSAADNSVQLLTHIYNGGSRVALHANYNGNVGIGTTSPGAKLEVIGPDSSTGTIKWQNGNRKTGYLYSDTGGVAIYTTALANAGIYLLDNQRIDFRVNGSERMRLTSSGNLGIGDTGPVVKLVVADKSLTRHSNSSWGQSAIANPNDAECAFVWGAGGTGYPGVTSTYTRQWIAGLSPFGTGTDRWSLTNKTLGANTAITVLENGKIGMGTITPDEKLTVNGITRAVDPIYFGAINTDNGTYGPYIESYDDKGLKFDFNGNTGGEFQIWNHDANGGGATEVFTIEDDNNIFMPSSNVTIGKTTSALGALDVDGTFIVSVGTQVRFRVFYTSNYTFVNGGTNGSTIYFGAPTTNVQNIRVQGTATATNFILSSDEILKDNIKNIDNKHIDVDWKNFELKSEPGVKRSGVIAQELEEKHPEFVRTDKEGLKSVAYIDLLIAKIAELEARLEKAGL